MTKSAPDPQIQKMEGVQAAKSNQALFICTGNFYRSRLSEALFNYYCYQEGLNWKAFSRGLNIQALSDSQRAEGISHFVVERLRNLKIPFLYSNRQPTSLTLHDLEQSQYTLLLSRVEHEPLLRLQISGAPLEKVKFWEVADSPLLNPDQAMDLMQSLIKGLISDLKKLEAAGHAGLSGPGGQATR